MAMAGRRRYKVRVRGKVRNQLLRRGGAAAGLALGLAAALWFFGTAIKASRGFLAGRFLPFRPASFDVNCPSPSAAESLRAFAASAVNQPLTSRRCSEMADEIKRLHPSLAVVKVGRNFITGKASIEARPEATVAPVLLNGATAYLGASGRFMQENLSPETEPAFTVDVQAQAPVPELAAFLTSVKPLSGLFSHKPLALSCALPGDGCVFRLDDGSSVLWGEFEFTRAKILRLNEVMERASRKSAGPFRVDLRFFREGKIFVSAAK